MFIVRFVRKDGKPDEEYYSSLMTMILTFMSV